MEILGFHDCDYNYAVDWLVIDINDLRLDDDKIIYSL
jgi:hypothetical protein